MLRTTLLGAAALLLAGCAPTKYCLEEQPYTKATSIPPLKKVEGVDLPESSAALRIPPPPESSEPFGKVVKDEEGKEVVQCLDRPPPMPKPVEPVQTIKPAQPKPAEPKPEEPKPAEPKPEAAP